MLSSLITVFICLFIVDTLLHAFRGVIKKHPFIFGYAALLTAILVLGTDLLATIVFWILRIILAIIVLAVIGGAITAYESRSSDTGDDENDIDIYS